MSTFWVGVYQPFAWLLFEIQYACWKLDPRAYHATSLFFHLANAVALYALTVALLTRCRSDCSQESPWVCSLSAGLASALFVVHPLRVETVAWASCQPYLPCALFSMLAVLSYLRAMPADSRPRRRWLVCSNVLFVAALLFKAAAVTLPVVLLILDVYPLRRFAVGAGRWFDGSARPILLEKVPFVLMSLLFMGLAVAARSHMLMLTNDYAASEGLAQACYGIWFYILKTVAPHDLIVVYPLPGETNFLAYPFSAAILATLAFSAGLVLLYRRWPGLLAVWLSYLVILAPNSGVMRNNNFVIAADRYSYLAMLGSVILAAAGLCRLLRMSSRRNRGAIAAMAVCLGALPVLTFMTRNQCRTWFSSETLWAHAVSHGAKSSSVAHYNLGVALKNQGSNQAALAHFAEALRLDPGNAAIILAAFPGPKFRSSNEAVQSAVRACELSSWKDPSILETLAAAYAEVGDFEAAVASQEKAIERLADEKDKADFRSRLAPLPGHEAVPGRTA